MRELAESTGGFVVTDTNEIALPMKRVMEDIRSHYEIAYTPSATNYNGHFRKIEVKIARSHLEVRTRKGYFALPDLNGRPLQPFEANAIAAMNAHGSEDAFPYRVAVMKFRPRQYLVEHEVAFEVPVSGLRATADPKTGRSRIKAALVGLIRDAKGEVVGKISRELVRDIADSTTTSAANDRILYAEPIELPGGHYELDAAVTDEQSGKTAVKRLAFYVDSGKEFGLSSLEVVRPDHFATGRTISTSAAVAVDPAHMLPVLSDSLASGSTVDLYFVLYPQQSGEIARKPLKLPEPEPDGSVPIMLKLSPTVGRCDILVTAQQGTLVSQSALSVKVE